MQDSHFSQTTSDLQNLLADHQDVGIVIGDHHTIDKVGAALALYLSLTQSGKNVQVISSREPIVEVANLVGIDQLKKSFDGKVSLMTVSFPLNGKAIQKVSYNTEKEWLHLNVFAGDEGLNFTERDVQFVKKGSSPSLIFAFGLPSAQDVINLAGSDSIQIVNIDSHPSNQMYGDVVLADPSFSSTSEIVAKLLSSLSLPIDIDIAQNLMDGLSFATRNLTAQNTSPFAFEATAAVMKMGARRRVMNDNSQNRRGDRDQSQGQGQNQGGQNRQGQNMNARPAGDRDRDRDRTSDRDRSGDRDRDRSGDRDRIGRPNFDRRNTQQQGPNTQSQPMSQRPQQPIQQQGFQSPQQDDTIMNASAPQPMHVQEQPQPETSVEDVPQDWFEPKIFSGAKTPDEN